MRGLSNSTTEKFEPKILANRDIMGTGPKFSYVTVHEIDYKKPLNFPRNS